MTIVTDQDELRDKIEKVIDFFKKMDDPIPRCKNVLHVTEIAKKSWDQAIIDMARFKRYDIETLSSIPLPFFYCDVKGGQSFIENESNKVSINLGMIDFSDEKGIYDSVRGLAQHEIGHVKQIDSLDTYMFEKHPEYANLANDIFVDSELFAVFSSLSRKTTINWYESHVKLLKKKILSRDFDTWKHVIRGTIATLLYAVLFDIQEIIRMVKERDLLFEMRIKHAKNIARAVEGFRARKTPDAVVKFGDACIAYENDRDAEIARKYPDERLKALLSRS